MSSFFFLLLLFAWCVLLSFFFVAIQNPYVTCSTFLSSVCLPAPPNSDIYLLSKFFFSNVFPVRYKSGSSPAQWCHLGTGSLTWSFFPWWKKKIKFLWFIWIWTIAINQEIQNVSMFDQKSGDEITVGQSYFFFSEWELIISWLFMHQQIGDHVSILLATEPQREKSFCSCTLCNQPECSNRARKAALGNIRSLVTVRHLWSS